MSGTSRGWKLLEQEQARREMVKLHAPTAQAAMQLVERRLLGDEDAGLQALEPSKLSATEVVRLMEAAAKLERISRGLPEQPAAPPDVPTHDDGSAGVLRIFSRVAEVQGLAAFELPVPDVQRLLADVARG